jgi:hypothetical protein
MTPEQILEELSKKHGKPPVRALQAAIEQRAEVAPLMLAELDLLLASFNEAQHKARDERQFNAMGQRLVAKPSPLFYEFLLAAEWKEKAAYPRFAELLSWPWAGVPNLLGEVVYDDLGARIMAAMYDGDPSPLFKLRLDDTASENIRFWQWRTVILLVLGGALDLETVRKFLIRAFDELEQEPEQIVRAGWEEGIIYFGLDDLTPLVERAHAVERIQDGTIEEFHEKFAYARAHPDKPFKMDEFRPFKGLMSEIGYAVDIRSAL